jgi:DNA replication protein DnaC
MARLQEARHSQQTSGPSQDESTSRRQVWLNQRSRAAGIPPRFIEDARWDQVLWPELVEWKGPLLEAKLNHGRGLILDGPVGTGKSSAAALIAREVLDLSTVENVRRIRWESTSELIHEMEADAASKRAVELRLTAPDLVVFDDLGVEKLAYWQVALLDVIMNIRYTRRKSIIVTMNVPIGDLAKDEQFGRIVSRWRQTCTAVSMTGADRREKLT